MIIERGGKGLATYLKADLIATQSADQVTSIVSAAND
jgi:hypothetical protein